MDNLLTAWTDLVDSFGTGNIPARLPPAVAKVDQILEHEPDSAADGVLADDQIDIREVFVEIRKALKR